MDFDAAIDRRNTGCVKYDGLKDAFGNDNLIPLWVADMDFAVCPAIQEALMRRVEHPVYGYSITPESYWQSIIDWCATRHGFNFTKEELRYVPGVVRGLSYAILHFTRPGDRVLIQPPVYHPFRHIIEGNGRKVVNNRLLEDADGHFLMDFDLLERQLRDERPAMMILCNPHNPGGRVWTADELRRVAKLCRTYGTFVASDEIHGDVELFGNRYTPFASVSEDATQNSIMLAAPSKTFNIPGIVSSWCVIKNEKLRRSFFHFLDVNEYSAPTMFVTAATEAAYRHGSQWLDEVLRYIEDNIVFVEDFLHREIPEIRPIRPQASFLVWLDCTATGLQGDALRRLFVDKAGLALNDGEIFGPGGERHMRLNVACTRATLADALSRLAKAF